MIIVGAPGTDREGPLTGLPTPDGHSAGGAAFVFVPQGGRYVETLRLRPRPDEKFAYEIFGSEIAMFGSRIAISAREPTFPPIRNFGMVFTYSRAGSSVIARGIVAGDVDIADPIEFVTALGIANNWLLTGTPFDFCTFDGCVGAASIFDLNRFAP